MRLACFLVAVVLAFSSVGCAASTQTKAGAVLFFGGLAALGGGVGVVVDHCSPSPELCRAQEPGRVEIGAPLLAAGALAVVAGGALVMTARNPPPDPPAPPPPPPAPRRRGEWTMPF